MSTDSTPVITIVDHSLNSGNSPWPYTPKWTGDTVSYLDYVRNWAKASSEYAPGAVVVVLIDTEEHAVTL